MRNVVHRTEAKDSHGPGNAGRHVVRENEVGGTEDSGSVVITQTSVGLGTQLTGAVVACAEGLD